MSITKNISIAVSIVALGASSVAMAGALDYNKPAATPAAMPVAAPAPAPAAPMVSESGAYVGAQIGYGSTKLDSATGIDGIDVIHLRSDKNSGVTGRLYAGYKFNRYLALELGIGKFSNATWNVLVNNARAADLTVKNNFVADLLAKGMIPVNEMFAFYGKAGLAYVKTGSQLNVGGTKFSDGTNFTRPKLALGVEYAVNENVIVDAEISRIFKQGTINDALNNGSKYMPNMDAAMVGVRYQFS